MLRVKVKYCIRVEKLNPLKSTFLRDAVVKASEKRDYVGR